MAPNAHQTPLIPPLTPPPNKPPFPKDDYVIFEHSLTVIQHFTMELASASRCVIYICRMSPPRYTTNNQIHLNNPQIII